MLLFNGLVLTVALRGAALAWLREELGLLGILGIVLTIAFQTGVALLVMWLLPRRAERWQELVPGAVLIAVGAQLVSLAVVFYFAPKIGRSSELYGTLGTASVLLVWLYLVARLITAGAFLNATLWERRYGSFDPGRGCDREPSGRMRPDCRAPRRRGRRLRATPPRLPRRPRRRCVSRPRRRGDGARDGTRVVLRRAGGSGRMPNEPCSATCTAACSTSAPEPGRHSLEAQRRGLDVVAIDVSPGAVGGLSPPRGR